MFINEYFFKVFVHFTLLFCALPLLATNKGSAPVLGCRNALESYSFTSPEGRVAVLRGIQELVEAYDTAQRNYDRDPAVIAWRKHKIKPTDEEVQRMKDYYNEWGDKVRAFEARHPAFAKDVDSIFYHYKIVGFELSLEHDPHPDNNKEPTIKRFKLSYDPSKFLPGSLLRRTFGKQKIEYDLSDIRHHDDGSLGGIEGALLNLYLKDPNDKTRQKDNGPLLMISRYSGRLLFWPTDRDGLGFFQVPMPVDVIRGLVTETQNAWGKTRNTFGDWFTSREASVTDTEPSSQTTPLIEKR